MRCAAIGAALLIGACSPAAETGPTETAEAGPARAVPASPSAAAPSAARPLVGGQLSADVSSLSGDISGLSVKVTDLGTVIALDADVLFDFDKDVLKPEAAAQLAKTADLIRAGGEGPVPITGFTDAKGDEGYNLDLSKRRARAVEAWLREQVGVRKRTFAVSGRGEAEPVAPNTLPDGADNPAGRAKNRRVEVLIPAV